MARGKVKFFNTIKKYGFLSDDATGVDYFFHVTDMVDPTLEKADIVSFQIGQNRKGVCATDVRKVEE